MTYRWIRNIFAILVTINLPLTAHSDIIHLNDGVIYGKIVSETHENLAVKIDCGDNVTDVPKQSVTQIERNPICSPPSPTFAARDFTVYFPSDQYVITAEAHAVLQDAAKYAKEAHATRVDVTGYTDTSASVAYSLRMSERRAKAAADSLVALGVPPDKLIMTWKGKSDLAVPTADGEKEPLNRRATIHIEF